jgi:hypothetical protein
VHRLAAKNDYDASETGECDSNLRRCAKSFTRFHGYRFSVKCDVMRWKTLPFFEITLVLVRFDDAARLIVNANHAIF